VFGLAPMPAADPTIRARHAEIARDHGRAALHAELAVVDPAAAQRLSPNDFVRVSRALEIHDLTGRTQTDWHADHGFRTKRYRARFLGLERGRDELEQRIARRVDVWLEQGFIDEVRRLLASGYGEARAMSSVGYHEVREHVEGRLPSD